MSCLKMLTDSKIYNILFVVLEIVCLNVQGVSRNGKELGNVFVLRV